MEHLRTVREPREILSIPARLEETTNKYPDTVAVKVLSPTGWKKWTYRELLNLVKIRGQELRKRGINEGDRAALFGPNTPEWIITYYAIHWIGAICVPLDNRLSFREVHHLINDSGSKTLFASPNGVSDSIDMAVEMDVPEVEVEEIDLKRASPELDKPAVILYTSGTTGSPKGAVLTHRNLMSNVEMLYQTMEFSPGEGFYALLPLHHVFAQTVSLLAPFSLGSTVILPRSFKSSEIKEDCQKGKPVIFPVVPLILEKFVEGVHRELKKLPITKKAALGVLSGMANLFNSIKEGSGSKFFSSIREALGADNLRYLVSGGAPLPNWVAEELEKWGLPLIQGYGLTETSPVVSVNPPESPRNDSVGHILPGVDVNIMNPDESGVGEIAVKGSIVFKGYWKNPAATDECFSGEWFKTGDMGYFDEDSYLHITGRKKSVIVTSGGKNIYPEEIENYLSKSRLIEEILVLHKINPNTGKKELMAYIYPDFEGLDIYCEKHNIKEKDPRKILMDEIKKLNQELTDYKRIRRIRLRDEEFPKTTTEKVKRYLFEEEEGVEV